MRLICIRFVVAVFVSVACFAFASGAQFQFTSPLPLNSDATSDSSFDSENFLTFGTDGAGVWVATFQRSLSGWFVARSTTNGATWSNPVQVTFSSTLLFPSVASDGEGTFIVAWGGDGGFQATGPDTDIFFRRSTTNGASWEALDWLNPNADSDSGSDGKPSIASDGNDTWVCMWESTEDIDNAGTGDYDIMFSRSTDDGVTWSTPALVNTTYGVSGDRTDDNVQIATDGAGNWVAVWQSIENPGTYGTDRDVFYSYSDDNGATWSAELPLNSNAPGGGSSVGNFGPKAVYDGAGTWITVWVTNDSLGSTIGTDNDVLFATSSDDGQTWSTLATLNPNADSDILSDSNTDIVSDGAGNVSVTWEVGAANPYIAVSKSTNGGASWSSVTTIDDPFANSIDINPIIGATGTDDWIVAFNSQPTGGGSPYGTDQDAFFVIDGNPIVLDIALAGTTPTNSQTVEFDVTFSEAVSAVDPGDFSVPVTGLSGVSIDSVVLDSGSTYTVTVDTGTGDGTVALSVIDNDTIVDGFSNPLGGAGAGNGNFGPSAAYVIDRVGPTIDLSMPSTPLTNTGPVTFTVTYGGATAITLAPGNVSLNSSGTANATVGVSGAGLATRTVTLSSITGDGDLGITIAAGTATDGVANGAPGVGPSTTFTVDNTAPNVTVEPLFSFSPAPKLEGGIDDVTATIVVNIGVESHPATNFGGFWEVAAGTFADRSAGVYTVTATATDAAGNVGMDSNPLEIFSTSPTGGAITSNLPLGLIQEGQYLELTAPAGSSGHVWFKDGEPMSNDPPRLTGTASATLIFDTVELGDSGEYIVVFDDGSKTILSSEPLDLVVLASGSLPVRGVGITALVLAILALVYVRRKHTIRV